jgi:aspartate/methionine/tyrosine aminotransferase
MTGWRLGWMVVPEALVPVVERLAQNLFICASTMAQHAALACFEPESSPNTSAAAPSSRPGATSLCRQLNAMGLTVPVPPDGAFYAWADCTQACQTLGVKDSWDSPSN